ncbi:MAG: PEP-CTERM sorting domain-containing protein [Planctomycetota bacterium]
MQYSASRLIPVSALALACAIPVTTTFAQDDPSILFIRGAERSGGFLEAGNNDQNRTDQLADVFDNDPSSPNRAWGTLGTVLENNGFSVTQLIEPLEPGAPSSGGTTGSRLDLPNLNLAQYDVVVFGSNNAQYTEADADAVESYLRGGGGAVFISDANFGGNWADASDSDQPFLNRLGLTANQDQGTYQVRRDTGDFLIPNHPILVGDGISPDQVVDIFDGEGVTPVTVADVQDLPDGVIIDILANHEGNVRRNNGPDTGNQIGTSEASGPQDAALVAGTIDAGRFVWTFDRNTFFNDGGAGTDITNFDNEQYAINLFTWAATPIPEPSTLLVVAAGSLTLLARRRR